MKRSPGRPPHEVHNAAEGVPSRYARLKRDRHRPAGQRQRLGPGASNSVGTRQRPYKKAKRVLGMHADALSYRLIARNVGLSKNTVMDIVRPNSSYLRAPWLAQATDRGDGDL